MHEGLARVGVRGVKEALAFLKPKLASWFERFRR